MKTLKLVAIALILCSCGNEKKEIDLSQYLQYGRPERIYWNCYVLRPDEYFVIFIDEKTGKLTKVEVEKDVYDSFDFIVKQYKKNQQSKVDSMVNGIIKG